MRTLPHRDGLEAFFAAALVKTGIRSKLTWFMALTTRVWGAGKLLLLAGSLLPDLRRFAAASMRFAIRAREVVVPQLGGQTVNEANCAAAGHGADPEGRREPAARP